MQVVGLRGDVGLSSFFRRLSTSSAISLSLPSNCGGAMDRPAQGAIAAAFLL
jgi:hypothetical protein